MSEPKTAQQFNMELTGQVDLPEIRQHIEAVKDAVTVRTEIIRFMLEDLLTIGDCFVHLPTSNVIPVETLVLRGDHYEQVVNGIVIASYPTEAILHLRRMVP